VVSDGRNQERDHRQGDLATDAIEVEKPAPSRPTPETTTIVIGVVELALG
jgi:hypothetical protein